MKTVCFFPHNNNLTGANRSMLDLLDELSKITKNYRFIVILPKSGVLENELKSRNIIFKVINSYSLINNINDLAIKKNIKGFIKMGLNLFSKIRIKYFIKKNSVTFVHINNTISSVGAECAKSLDIPYIYHLRDFLVEDHNIEYTYPKMMSNLLRHAKTCIGISDIIVEYYKKKYDIKNTVRIYNGINKEKNYYYRDTIKSKKNIVTVGRISPGKNQLQILEVFKNLKEKKINGVGKLFIIGTSGDNAINKSYEKSLKKFVLDNNLSSEVAFIPQTNDVLSYRKLSDITIVPSKLEAFGRVTVEGMFAQQIVVASDTGANPELIKNGANGFLYSLDSNEMLETLIANICNLPDSKLKDIQEAASIDAIGEFPIERTAKNTLKLYDSIDLI